MNPLNLSYSSIETFHSCSRLFEIEKLLLAGEKEEKNIDFITGHCIGEGLQLLLQGENIETVIFNAYKKWLPLGLDYEHKKKTFWRVEKHLEQLEIKTLPEKFYSLGWELVYFTSDDGKKIPACEISFCIILPGGYRYRGYIDALLYNKNTGEFAVLECKTTGIQPNVAMYQNSFQGSSYSLVLEKITGQKSYTVFYPIMCFPGGEQEVFEFTKTEADKLEWLQSLAFDCKRISEYKEARYFPKNGASCYAFFRPCKFLGLCSLNKVSLGKYDTERDSYVEQPLDIDRVTGKENTYHFTFTLDQLLSESGES